MSHPLSHAHGSMDGVFALLASDIVLVCCSCVLLNYDACCVGRPFRCLGCLGCLGLFPVFLCIRCDHADASNPTWLMS